MPRKNRPQGLKKVSGTESIEVTTTKKGRGTAESLAASAAGPAARLVVRPFRRSPLNVAKGSGTKQVAKVEPEDQEVVRLQSGGGAATPVRGVGQNSQ
eukprot:5617009-Amphidinium_carterae.2